MACVLHTCICRVGCRDFGVEEGGFKGKTLKTCIILMDGAPIRIKPS